MHRVIYEAYDKGYAQGRQDFERPRAEWSKAPANRYMGFLCSRCDNVTICAYPFCPYCGSPMTEDAYGTEKE